MKTRDRREATRRWLLFVGLLSLGLLNKYSIDILIPGLLIGLLCTKRRRLLTERGPWLAAGAALIVFLPHLLWQVFAGFPSLEFIRNAALYKNTAPGPLLPLLESLLHLTLVGLGLLVCGLVFALTKAGKPWRFLTAVYPLAFILTALGGKTYYLAPAFLVTLPLGAAALEHWTTERARRLRTAVPVAFPLLSTAAAAADTAALGVVPASGEGETGALPQYLADRLGWDELVDDLAALHHDLPAEVRADCGLFCQNYGQAGAVDLFGPPQTLPPAACAHNSYWHWGPPPVHEHWLVVGGDPAMLAETFAEVELLEVYRHPWVMEYENDKPLWLCSRPLVDLAELWQALRFYI